MKTDKRVIRRREIQGEAAHCYAKITNDLNYFMAEDFDKNKKLFKKG